jgi:hypothetical protein
VPVNGTFDFTNDQFQANFTFGTGSWPDNDVVALRFWERLPNGSLQEMDGAGIGPGNYRTKYTTIGIADRPPDSSFPRGIVDANQAVPTEKFSSSQSNNTFLSRKGLGRPGIDRNTLGGLPTRVDQMFVSGEQLVAVAAYKNDGDLGFGRLMLCALTSDGSGNITGTKCMVANYRTAEEAALGGTPIATVAMDRASPGASVYFGAYNAAGNSIDEVPLDGGGSKRLPFMCLNCHGGTPFNGFADTTKPFYRARFSSFLPFDLDILSLPSNVGDQSLAFRVLNQVVFFSEYMHIGVAGANYNVDVMDLLLTMYENTGGLFGENSNFDPKAVPDGWAGNPALYTTVVAPYCRGCHIAFRASNGQQSPLTFHTESAFLGFKSAIKAQVCDKTGFVMPQSQRVYHRFWASGARAALAVDLGITSCAFKSQFSQ